MAIGQRPPTNAQPAHFITGADGRGSAFGALHYPRGGARGQRVVKFAIFASFGIPFPVTWPQLESLSGVLQAGLPLASFSPDVMVR